MDKQDIADYLSSIGASGTRVAAGNKVPDVIGQFGIGFLSAFVVASRVEVRTRHFRSKDQTHGWLWHNEGRKDYTLDRCNVAHIGTEIRVFLHDVTDRGLLHEDALRRTVSDYADMLKVPIHLNRSDVPANARVMPWERHYSSGRDRAQQYRMYLERSVPGDVLEVIPLHLEPAASGGGISADGLLYITRRRRIAGDLPRNIRLFHKRMFVCENKRDILPEWATFVNGIINTPDLTPNAARDNFVLNATYAELRAALGNVVIAHFEALAHDDPDRLSHLLAYHNLAIKSACDAHPQFFQSFGHLLNWRINARSPVATATPDGHAVHFPSPDADTGDRAEAWATLPTIIAALPARADDAHKPTLWCFTTFSYTDHFFEMADAAGITVIDATSAFERRLLESWVREHAPEVTLAHIDRDDDDPDIFTKTDADRDARVEHLAQRMTGHIRPHGTGSVRVEARRFPPASIPAVIRWPRESEWSSHAEVLIADPETLPPVRDMAEKALRAATIDNQRMTINADNALIRKLAEVGHRVGYEGQDILELMVGVYNASVLRGPVASPRDEKIFHEQFGRLMMRITDCVLAQQDLVRRVMELDRREEALRRREGGRRDDRSHTVAFLMTPFNKEFEQTRRGVQAAIERLGCELRTADRKTFDDFIHKNVQKHLNDADFYIADLTGLNVNVLLELGAVLFQSERRPMILLWRVAEEDDERRGLPAEISGAVVIPYREGWNADTIAAELHQKLLEHEPLTAILGEETRDLMASVELIRGRVGTLGLGDDTLERLSAALPTVSAWRRASIAEVGELLPPESRDLAPVVRRRIAPELSPEGHADLAPE